MKQPRKCRSGQAAPPPEAARAEDSTSPDRQDSSAATESNTAINLLNLFFMLFFPKILFIGNDYKYIIHFI